MDDNCIKQIACGILFNHSFSVFDSWGRIADKILYSSNLFDSKYFNKVGDQATNSRVLFNDKEGQSLQLTANNLIYTHYIQADFNKEYKLFQERVLNELLPTIVDNYNLAVRRIGIVFTCMSDPNVIEEYKNKWFSPELKGVTDFRFAKRESTTSALFDNQDDYINKIITIGHFGEEQYSGFSYDYQLFLLPPRQDVDDKTNKVLEYGLKELKREMFGVTKG